MIQKCSKDKCHRKIQVGKYLLEDKCLENKQIGIKSLDVQESVELISEGNCSRIENRVGLGEQLEQEQEDTSRKVRVTLKPPKGYSIIEGEFDPYKHLYSSNNRANNKNNQVYSNNIINRCVTSKNNSNNWKKINNKNNYKCKNIISKNNNDSKYINSRKNSSNYNINETGILNSMREKSNRLSMNTKVVAGTSCTSKDGMAKRNVAGLNLNIKGKRVIFQVLNIRGFNKGKYTELENMFFQDSDVINIVCLTETQHKYEKVLIHKDLRSFTAMRNAKDKKGGGIQVILPRVKQIRLNKVENENKDLLELEGELFGIDFRMIVVYFDSKKYGEGRKRNYRLSKILEDKLENNEKEGLMIMGDFNGHIKILDQSKDDANGKMVMKWMDDYNLTLLNLDEKCEGLYTWRRKLLNGKEQKSAIDFFLVNNRMYELFKGMSIDEDRLRIDYSDHSLLSAEFMLKGDSSGKKKTVIQKEYFKKDAVALRAFKEDMEKVWSTDMPDSVEQMDDSMKLGQARTLKATFRMRVSKGEGITAKNVWMNREILAAIAKRKEFNRLRRNCKDETERKALEKKYLNQKFIVQKLVRDALEKHELKLTKEVNESNDKGKLVWKNLNKLMGKDSKVEEEVRVYDKEKKLLDPPQAKEEILGIWRDNLNVNSSDIGSVWNDSIRENLMGSFDNERKEAMSVRRMREHLDMDGKVEGGIVPMEIPEFTMEDLEDELKRLKFNKAVGTNRLRAELYKVLGESEVCKRVMVECFNNIIKTGNIPPSWKMSRTRLIKKVEKPTSRDFRPIAITNISYKIFFSFYNKHLEKHISANSLGKENQLGFTKGGRIEYNHLILQYVIGQANRVGSKLIVMALDFKKAFDSIDRSKLIEVLKEYRVHPNMIDLIAKVYSSDRTTLSFGDIEEEIEITSGIKQGCTVSTTLFKLVTYMIMTNLEEKGTPYEIDNIKLSSIFFADDSIAIAKTMEDAKKNLGIVSETSKVFGLHINKDKSNVLIYNNSEGIEDVDDIKVVHKIKYLGLMISDGQDIFKDQKEEMINKASRYANLTYSVIAKSYNKMRMGKTFWKGVVLSSVLYGAGLMNTTAKELNRLQVVENGVYRKILGARRFTALEALRGDIGSSLMETRFIKSRFMLIKSIHEGDNGLIKEVLKNIRKDRYDPWNCTLNLYLKWVKISYDELINMDRVQVDKKVKEYDGGLWMREMATKSSLIIYSKYKKVVKEETVYDNRNSSVLLFQARTNSLNLNIEKRHQNGDITCSLCKQEAEDSFHFIFICTSLERKRDTALLNECRGNTRVDRLGVLLYEVVDIERVKRLLQCLWQLRHRLLKSI